jgi:hypothetical protein
LFIFFLSDGDGFSQLLFIFLSVLQAAKSRFKNLQDCWFLSSIYWVVYILLP